MSGTRLSPLAISDDGTRVAYLTPIPDTEAGCRLNVFETATGESRFVVRIPNCWDQALDITGDGQTVVGGYYREKKWDRSFVVDLDTDELVDVFPPTPKHSLPGDPLLTDNGKTWVYMATPTSKFRAGEGTVRRWRVGSDHAKVLYRDWGTGYNDIAPYLTWISSDASRFAMIVSGWDRTPGGERGQSAVWSRR